MASDGLSLIFRRFAYVEKKVVYSLWLATRATRESAWSEPIRFAPGGANDAVEPYLCGDDRTLCFRMGQELYVSRRVPRRASLTPGSSG
jgi:hypothetical protein